MPLDPLEFHISLRRLLAALILMLVPITVFGFYIGLRADQQAHEMTGTYFRALTRSAARTTAEFVGQRVSEVGFIANDPTLIQSVTAANRSYEHMDTAAIQAHAERIDANWNAPESDTLVQNVLTSDLALWLRRCRELNPRLLKITVADQTGATVAATDKPVHYFQTERESWQALQSGGRGALHVSELRYDDQSKSQYISVAYPVLQAGTGRFIGAVIGLVDVAPLFSTIYQQQFTQRGRVFLVRDDGIVLAAPGVTPSMKVKSEEFTAIRDALGTLRGREAGYLNATLPRGETSVIGFADTGLRDAYPNLDWTVIATVSQRDAFGPMLALAQYALLIMIVALLMLTVLGAYVFLHRKQSLSDLAAPSEETPRKAA